MWALEVPGRVTWWLDLVGVSIALGMLFGMTALAIAVRREDMRGTVAAALLLTLAIEAFVVPYETVGDGSTRRQNSRVRLAHPVTG